MPQTPTTPLSPVSHLPPTPWLNRVRAGSPASSLFAGGRKRALSSVSSLSHIREPSHITWLDALETQASSSEEDDSPFRDVDESSGGSEISNLSLSHGAYAESRGSVATSLDSPIEPVTLCRPRSEVLRLSDDQVQKLTQSFNSYVLGHSITSLASLPRHPRFSSNLSSFMAPNTPRRLSLDTSVSRKERDLSQYTDKYHDSSPTQRQGRVSLSCDIPYAIPYATPAARRSRRSTVSNNAPFTAPSRTSLLTPVLSRSSAASRVVDTKLAEDLFECWTRGEAQPVFMSHQRQLHQRHGRSASAGSHPAGYHYVKRSNSLTQRSNYEALARVGGVRIRSSLSIRGGRVLTDDAGKQLHLSSAQSAHIADVPIDGDHYYDDQSLDGEGDETSTAPSTSGPITPSSAHFPSTALSSASCSRRASVSQTIEEEDSDRECGSAGISIPGLRLRQGFAHSYAPRQPSMPVPAGKSGPTAIEDDPSSFLNPRRAPRPPVSEELAEICPEVKATRALLSASRPLSWGNRPQTSPGGTATVHPKGRFGASNHSLPTVNEEAGQKKKWVSKLGIGHFGLKSIGVKVKAESGRVRFAQ
ncbi:hypothetical protein V5O48_015368 [Marasmius crinis-equi]|uniref:Uncharacterized protein n=1 Tax=Marasmius crinis-equi TaxID=585013 RepID=A0ABR3EUR1_9AGAR